MRSLNCTPMSYPVRYNSGSRHFFNQGFYSSRNCHLRTSIQCGKPGTWLQTYAYPSCRAICWIQKRKLNTIPFSQNNWRLLRYWCVFGSTSAAFHVYWLVRFGSNLAVRVRSHLSNFRLYCKCFWARFECACNFPESLCLTKEANAGTSPEGVAVVGKISGSWAVGC